METSSRKDSSIAFESISELVKRFEKQKQSGAILSLKEEQTKNDFIIPLFEALGWNTQNKENRDSSMTLEERISKKRGDLGFRLNGIPRFFVECKAAREPDIENNEEYISQAINYSWNKVCSWAILTNFDTLAVYNADWKESNLRNGLFFILHPKDFLSDERFRLLSKESFLNGKLDEEALKWGKKQKKERVDEQLLQDMIHFREILSRDILKNNQDKHLSQDDIDESVQRMLDRFIFIRNAEDRGLEENKLQSDVRQWSTRGKGQLVREIVKVYSYFDDRYNSKLFAHHLCDDLYVDNEVLEEVIEGLNQSKDGSYRYDFSAIESDTLGNIYEQYLGNILKSTAKRAKLEISKTHRKEQGIYYTPSFVVDYIVKSTVGEYIKTHTFEEIRNVKILDPACGSGSFLISAYQELENYWKRNSDFAQLTLDSEEFYSKKVDILKNNIFGIDLDPKAVEIAQLNLLLKISATKQRLPILQNNIQIGNSLIDDPNVSNKALKWEEKFPEIMKNGGFDIIIGNPPYVNALQLTKSVSEDTRIYWKNKYLSARGAFDIYILFFEQGLKICKNDGYVSFITPNKYLSSPYGTSLRQLISRQYRLAKVSDLSSVQVFGGPSVYPIITQIRKTKMDNEYEFITEKIASENLDEKETYRVSSRALEALPDYLWGGITSNNLPIIERIFSVSEPLEKVAEVQATSTASEADEYSKYINENQKGMPIINTGTIDRYSTTYGIDKFVDKGKRMVKPILDVSKVSETRAKLYMSPKIVVAKMALRIEGFLDSDGSYASINTNCVHTPSKGYSLSYLVGLLNSKLQTFVYSELFSGLRMSGGYFQFQAPQLRMLPIATTSSQVQIQLETLVKRIAFLTEKLNHYATRKIDESEQIKEEIERTNSEIDELVYNIYRLNENERKIIERM